MSAGTAGAAEIYKQPVSPHRRKRQIKLGILVLSPLVSQLPARRVKTDAEVISSKAVTRAGEPQETCVLFLGVSCGCRKVVCYPFPAPKCLSCLGDQLWDIHHLGHGASCYLGPQHPAVGPARLRDCPSLLPCVCTSAKTRVSFPLASWGHTWTQARGVARNQGGGRASSSIHP